MLQDFRDFGIVQAVCNLVSVLIRPNSGAAILGEESFQAYRVQKRHERIMVEVECASSMVTSRWVLRVGRSAAIAPWSFIRSRLTEGSFVRAIATWVTDVAAQAFFCCALNDAPMLGAAGRRLQYFLYLVRHAGSTGPRASTAAPAMPARRVRAKEW